MIIFLIFLTILLEEKSDHLTKIHMPNFLTYLQIFYLCRCHKLLKLTPVFLLFNTSEIAEGQLNTINTVNKNEIFTLEKKSCLILAAHFLELS